MRLGFGPQLVFNTLLIRPTVFVSLISCMKANKEEIITSNVFFGDGIIVNSSFQWGL